MLLQFYYNLHVQTVSPSNFLLSALPRLSAPLKTQIWNKRPGRLFEEIQYTSTADTPKPRE